MKIKITSGYSDYRDHYIISIDDKEIMSFFDGEVEDNCLTRNFNDIYLIPEILEQVYQAGKNGEVLEIEEIEKDDHDS